MQASAHQWERVQSVAANPSHPDSYLAACLLAVKQMSEQTGLPNLCESSAGIVEQPPHPIASTELKRCACGADPVQLVITEGSCSKYAWAACDSCGEWSIEFRTNYSQDPAELQRLAAKAWNAALRSEFPYTF